MTLRIWSWRVWDWAARQNSRPLDDLLARVDDATIAMAIRGVRELVQCQIAMRRSGTIRLSWPSTRGLSPQPELVC
jgi:hypothetical protein